MSQQQSILVYTDGACSGNPGPAGIGVVLVCAGRRKELSEYIGEGTNNIAELTAIRCALEAIRDRERPVVVHSDSEYAIGVLTKNWKPKANKQLIAEIRALAATFPHLELKWVRGHAGVAENERCDQLARLALPQRAS